MNYYLVILEKISCYNFGEYETLWLPTTQDEIESALNRLGCNWLVADHRITYAGFGFPEIDRMAYDCDVFTLNKLATELQNYKGTPDVLCAELVYMECVDIYDVLNHLENRPNLIVEPLKDILKVGEDIVIKEYCESKELPLQMTFDEYQKKLYYENGCSMPKCYIKKVLESMYGTYFRFTPYGIVRPVPLIAPASFDDIELPF